MPALETLTPTDFSAVLVRLSRECGVGVEHLRAEQLVRESQLAWPGEEGEQWTRWLLEASECLALRTRMIDLPLEDALHLSQDGALLVGCHRPGQGVEVLLAADNSNVELAQGEIDGRVRISHEEMAKRLGVESDTGQKRRWLVVEHPELSDADDARHLHGRPVQRLFRIVRPEWPDIWMIVLFAFFAGVLSLATPIAVEALVNTVAFGQLLQPVLVLAILLFGFLAFAAVMQAMQTYVAEVIQRRLFARVAADLAYRLPRVAPAGINGKYGPELVNRFLDVVTLQKVVASMLLDGIGIVLATLVGMTVLAFYHPWLLGFDVLLLLLIVSGLMVLGRGAIPTSILESKMKYNLAAWFEDLMRCNEAFKTEGGTDFAIDRANMLTSNYLTARRSHFSIVFRQITFVLGLQALAGTVLLGGGGWLVIQGQLSLGQLVAAELIVTTILASLAKLGKHLEGFYDLVASVDKLGALFDLSIERADGLLGGLRGEGLEIVFDNLRFPGWQAPAGLSAQIRAGERVALYGPAGSGKTMLTRLLFGLEEAASGRLSVGGSDPRDLRPDVLRSSVAMAAETGIFEGTIADNVHLRRAQIGAKEVRAALEEVGLLDEVLRLPDGIETVINASANPLTSTQQRLLMVARALAGRPRVLVIDSLLDALPDLSLANVLNRLTSDDRSMTLVVATGKSKVAERLQRTIWLADGASDYEQGGLP